MTAISLFHSRHVAQFMADGAVVNDTHFFQGTGPKVHVLHKARAAIGLRGSIFHEQYMKPLLEQMTSFEEVAERLPVVVQEMMADPRIAGDNASRFPLCASVDCFLAGVAKTGEVDAFYLSSGNLEPVRAPLLTAPEIDDALGAEAMRELSREPGRAAYIARRLVAAQRRNHLPVRVGGWVEVTTVSATGISRRIVGRWPNDRVGEMLEPDAVLVACDEPL